MPEPAIFLNLDLELRSREDLAPLAAYLDEHASLLYSGEHQGEFMLTAEPLNGGHPTVGPGACTDEMLSTLAALPPPLRDLMGTCHLRMFDYGFNGGLDSVPLSVDLSAVQLNELARVGIGLRVTIYPHRTDDLDNGNANGKKS